MGKKDITDGKQNNLSGNAWETNIKLFGKAGRTLGAWGDGMDGSEKTIDVRHTRNRNACTFGRNAALQGRLPPVPTLLPAP
jgi:hypothetical protein